MATMKRFAQVGDKVGIILNEPWDILETLGGKRLLGVITDTDQSVHDKVVLRLDEEIKYDRKEARFFYAQTRYVGSLLGSDGSYGMAICSFSSLSDDEGGKGLGTTITSWESRICAIGSLAWSASHVVPEEPNIDSDSGRRLFEQISETKAER